MSIPVRPTAFCTVVLTFAIAVAALEELGKFKTGFAGLEIKTAAAAFVSGVTPTFPLVGTEGDISKRIFEAPKGSRAPVPSL